MGSRVWRAVWPLLLAACLLGGQVGAARSEEPTVELAQQYQKLYLEAFAQGDFAQARDHLEKCLSVQLKVLGSQDLRTALSYHHLAEIHIVLGDDRRALENYQKSLTIRLKVLGRDHADTAASYFHLGNLHDSLSEHRQALESFRQALAIRLKVLGAEHADTADAYHNLGNVHDSLGDYRQALDCFQQALAIRLKVLGTEHADTASTYNNLGNIHDVLGDYSTAMECHQKALAIRLQVQGDEHADTADSYENLGIVHDSLGDYPRALENYQRALAIRLKLQGPEHLHTAQTYNNLGIVYESIGDYPRALEKHHQALAVFLKVRGAEHADTAASYNNLGNVHESLREYPQALESHQKALAIMLKALGLENPQTAKSYNNLGVAYRNLGDYPRALENHHLALAIKLKALGPNHVSTATSYSTMGKVEWLMGRHEAAVGHYDQALSIIEAMREGLKDKETRSSFMRNKYQVYDEFIDILQALHQKHPQRGYDRKAFEIFERKQGRQFLEEMGRSGARNFAGIPERVAQTEMDLEARISALGAEMDSERSKPPKEVDSGRLKAQEERRQGLEKDYQDLQAKIKSAHPDYHALRHPQPVSLAALQRYVLEPGEMLLVYNVMNDKTCLWVVGRDHFSLHLINLGAEELGQKVAAYRDLITNKARGLARGETFAPQTANQAASGELFATLVPQPARQALTQAKILYIVPTGPLYQLPFEALNTAAPSEAIHYLIEDYPVSYLSSASLLKILREAQSRRRAKAEHPLLAFADPVYGKAKLAPAADTLRGLQAQSSRALLRDGLLPLPETAEEARAISDILRAPAASRPLRLRGEASRSMVMGLNQSRDLARYRYVVFACHGVLPGKVARLDQPALALSDPDPQDHQAGFLTMADVFGLQFNADLVALSACNSGRGADVNGEGVMGLTRAFMYAGAPSVGVTLWAVETHSAKALNVDFFRHLHQGQSRAQALREVKLRLLGGREHPQWRHPYYWAPLVVFGEGQ